MFKKTLCINLLFLSIIGTAQVMWQFKKDTVITWNYFDGDEFNGNKVDTDKWKYWYGWSRSIFSNKEQQYYTDGENHILANGILGLTAIKKPITAKMVDWLKDEDTIKNGKNFYSLNKTSFEYKAGMIETKKAYMNGFFECRFKLPKQKGFWPAFWLHGGDPNEEIDIMECKSERTDQIHIDTHCPNRCDDISYLFQKRSYGGWVKTRDNFTEEYAVIACDWDKHQVRFYLDGECIGVSNVNFNVEKYLTLNIAVPSNNGPFKPGPDVNDTSVVVFEVDYVRVWKKESNNDVLKNNALQLVNANTNIQASKLLSAKSITKTKSKLVYGKKSDHKFGEIFISCFINKDNIQITSLGLFQKNKLNYKILSIDNKEIASGIIENQIFNISKSTLVIGEYIILINFNNKQVQKQFKVN